MDLDEVDLALLDLYAYGEDHGVSAAQFHRLLAERIAMACLIVSELEDQIADDFEAVTIH